MPFTIKDGINLSYWCSHLGSELHVGDLNGDRRADMLCHDRNTGKKWASLAKVGGLFSKTTW